MTATPNELAFWGIPEDIDPYGDLILLIGEHHRSDSDQQTGGVRVCSATLRRLSKLFRAMLFGPYRESKKPDSEPGEWVVDLPDDRLQPLRLILAIMHGRFDLVKGSQMKLRTFHQILVAADKYDLLAFLAPWILQWAQATMERTRGSLGAEEEGQCLVAAQIGWMLGEASIMCRELRVFVSCGRIDRDGNLFVLRDDMGEASRRGLNPSSYGCFPLDPTVDRATLHVSWESTNGGSDLRYFGPPNLVERLKETRLIILHNILQHMKGLIESLQCISAYGPSKRHVRRTCERVMANSLRRQLRDRNINIKNMDASEIRASQMDLRHCFETCLRRARCIEGHEACIPAWREIGTAFSGDPRFRSWKDGYETAILSPEYQTLLSMQCAKLAANDEDGPTAERERQSESAYCGSITEQFLKYGDSTSEDGELPREDDQTSSAEWRRADDRW